MDEDNDVSKTIRKNWRKFLRFFNRRIDHDRHIVSFTDDMIEEYAACHKLFQAAISIASNYRLGINVKSKYFSPRGIYKFEGGIKADNKDIVILRLRDGTINCYNDWNDKEKDTSLIVKEVTEEILRIQHDGNVGSAVVEYLKNNTNVPEGILWKKILEFVDNPFVGDPLRRLFTPR